MVALVAQLMGPTARNLAVAVEVATMVMVVMVAPDGAR
jgi:uncharacterized protein YhhL (DUF1145 family)